MELETKRTNGEDLKTAGQKMTELARQEEIARVAQEILEENMEAFLELAK